MPADDWPLAAPDAHVPAAGTVACWCIPLGALDGERGAALAALLDAGERARHARYRGDDGLRFLAGRAGLRVLAGAALQCDPRSLAFAAGFSGKPFLPASPLAFSVAHSGRVALVALARDAPVGIDVEALRPFAGRDDVARRTFHPDEAEALGAATDREAAFFRTWTRKEAVAKALGLGFRLPFDRFAVGGAPGEPRLTRIDPPHPPPEAWSLFDLDPAPGHAGAVALPLRPVRLRCRTLRL